MRRTSLCVTLLLTFTCSTLFAQTTFSRRTYPALGIQLQRGDFNRDGKPDLLGTSTGVFRVLLNNGDGTFERKVTSAQPGEHGRLTTADFNRDGRTDLGGCHVQNPEAPVSEFAIWTANGAGTFSLPRRFPLAGDCQSVAVEDFNQDGMQDAAVIWAVFSFSAPPNNGITVFFGDGAGGVSHSVTTAHIAATSDDGLPCIFRGGAAGNYDRAGSPDVVIAAFCNNDTFDQSILIFGRGTGTGHFAFTTTGEQNVSFHLAKDDVNQDSHLDLVSRDSMSGPHAAAYSALTFYMNTNGGGVPAWQERTAHSYGGDGDCIGGVHSGIAVDLNGDGIKDAAATEMFRKGDCIDVSETFNLVITRANGDGTYAAPQKISLASRPADVVSDDFDRDGRPDMALARGDWTEVFLNRNNTATCIANPALRTVKICAPASISGNTLHLRANTTSGGPVTGMKVYLDNSEVFFTPNDTINKKLNVPAGSHRITVRAWDGQGSFSSTMNVTAGTSSACATPSANRSINICSPVNESTVSNPVKVAATITSSNKYYGAKVYIDGVARHTTTSKQVNASFTLSAGRHRISVQAYDTQGSFTKTVHVNVR